MFFVHEFKVNIVYKGFTSRSVIMQNIHNILLALYVLLQKSFLQD